MRIMKIVFPILLLWGLSVPFTAWSEPCQMPDNGNGTAGFPPFCPYDNDEEVMMMIEGFPPGSGLYLEGPLTDFVNTYEEPGGTMGAQSPCLTLNSIGMLPVSENLRATSVR
jgi:hypothetical protein